MPRLLFDRIAAAAVSGATAHANMAALDTQSAADLSLTSAAAVPLPYKTPWELLLHEYSGETDDQVPGDQGPPSALPLEGLRRC